MCNGVPQLNLNRVFIKPIQIFLFLSLTTGTIIALLPLQKSIDAYMHRLKENTIASLEKSIGRSISYDSISPSILLYLEVRGVQISQGETETDINVDIPRVRVYYNFWDLIRGNIREAIHEVRLINSSFRIDSEKDLEFIESLRRLGSPVSISEDVQSDFNIPENLRLVGENISIKYSSGTSVYELHRLFFRFDIRDTATRLDIRGNIMAGFLSPVLISDIPLTGASGRIRINGQYRSENNEVSGRINLRDVSSNLFTFEELTLEAVSTPQRLVLRKIEDRSPYDFSIQYEPNGKNLKLNFAAENFVPSENIHPKDDLYPVSPWLDTVISGESKLSYSIASGGTAYDGNFELILDNEFTPFPLILEVKGGGTGEYAVLENLSVRSEKFAGFFRGKVLLSEPFAEGSLTVQRLVMGESHVLSGRAVLSGSREDFLLSTDMFRIGQIEIDRIRISGSLGTEEADFALKARYAEPSALPESDNISADGNIRFGRDRFMELSLSSKDIPLNQIIQESTPDAVSSVLEEGEYAFDTEAYVTTNFDRFSFSLLPFIIREAEGDRIASFRINGNNDRLRLTDLSLQVDEYSANGDVEIIRNSENTYSYNTAININSVLYELEGIYYRPSTLIVRGNHGLYLTLMLRPDYTAFSAQATNLPLPLLPERVTELTFSGRGTYKNLQQWNLQVPVCSVSNLPLLPEDNSIKLSGNFGPDAIQINELYYSDIISILNGRGQGSFSSYSPLEGEIQISLSNENDTEQYILTAYRRDAQISADARILNAPLLRISELPLSGNVSGAVSVTGSMEEPVVSYSVNMEDGEFRQNPVQVESTGGYTGRRLTVDYLHAEYRNHILQRGEGFIDLNEGLAQLKGQYRGIFAQKLASADVNLNAELEVPESDGTISALTATDMKALLHLSDIEMFGRSHNDWYININRTDGTLNFEGGPNNSLNGTLLSDGSFNFNMSDPLPVQLAVQSRGTAEKIDISAEDIMIQAEFLSMLGLQVVDFGSGTITGDLNITGAPNDPIFSGVLKANRFSGTVEYVNGAISPFNTQIEIDGKNATVKPVITRVEDRTAELKGGFSFDRWNVDSIRINVRTISPDGIPVLFRDQTSGLNIEGYATGTFNYDLLSNVSEISGDLTAQNCVITLEERQEGRQVRREHPVRVNLNIQTGRRVEFLWPRKNFPIIQAFPDTEQGISIYFDNITDSFQLKGTLDLKSGEIYYFQRSFYIKEGSITFNENEDKFDPLLQVEAQIKEIDNSGSPVTISLIVDNEPLSSFTPRFESNPTLSTTEIANILGTNLYTQFGQNQGELASALMITGDLFSQFSIVRSFEQQMKNVFRLDLFSIRTQMIQNVILERVLNQNITEDPESQGTVGSYLDNTTLFLGKYLGNDLFLEALVQIQQDPIATGDFGQNELDLSMEVGLEWKTPFFLLNFTISPDFQDPMDSLQNTSLGFSWDFSY